MGIVPTFLGSPLHSEIHRLNQRARHLRDWFYHLSPVGGTQEEEERDCDNSLSLYSYSHRYLSSPVPTFRTRTRSGRSQSSSVATSNDSILTPTENLDNPLGAVARRDSQGVLQSPDVLDPAKEDGFYLLKKDSQRRATLGKILKDDKHRICREWQSLLLKDVHDFCLTEQHLATLVDGMKGYIESPQNSGPLEKAVQDLRNALDYDGAMLNHLQLALYKVPEALNKVLRGHSIKPHWMFALEDLVRTAVQEAILILSPELGVHLGSVNNMLEQPSAGVPMHQDHHDDHDPDPHHAHDNEACSTSGVSTVNSGFQAGAAVPGLVSNLGRLREENRHLLTDLVRAQENYQELLRQSLAEQRLHLQMLSQSLAASSLTREPIQRQQGMVEREVDPRLVDWLRELGLNKESTDRILGEELTLTDMLELMDREDLKRLGLKAGPELRVWRAILTHRNVPLTPTSP